MNQPQHLAEQSATTRVREHVAEALVRVGIIHHGHGAHLDADA